jgi:hypothetical protein
LELTIPLLVVFLKAMSRQDFSLHSTAPGEAPIQQRQLENPIFFQVALGRVVREVHPLQSAQVLGLFVGGKIMRGVGTVLDPSSTVKQGLVAKIR